MKGKEKELREKAKEFLNNMGLSDNTQATVGAETLSVIMVDFAHSLTESVGDEEIEQFAEKLSEPLAEKGEYALAMAWKSGAINMAKWLRTRLSPQLTEERVVDANCIDIIQQAIGRYDGTDKYIIEDGV